MTHADYRRLRPKRLQLLASEQYLVQMNNERFSYMINGDKIVAAATFKKPHVMEDGRFAEGPIEIAG